MSLFNFRKEKIPKDTNSVEFKRYMAKKIDGKKLRYVLEREADSDRVIGKDGFLSLYNDELSVICGEKTLFCAKVDTLVAWEFISLEGVTLTAPDLVTGKERTVMAYYKYYRD